MNILSVFILGKRFEFLIRSEAVCRRDRSKNTAMQHVSIRLENFLLVCGWKWKSLGPTSTSRIECGNSDRIFIRRVSLFRRCRNVGTPTKKTNQFPVRLRKWRLVRSYIKYSLQKIQYIKLW
ncbi:hypothetical protein LEP1GSC165_3467 [Leptospira santarosai str. CBC523]|nr:hypothetical protein LEP1GSC165_3467 [Leptospira santarosai str. CBC523]